MEDLAHIGAEIAQGHAVAGELDGGLKYLGQGEGAQVLLQTTQPGDEPWRGYTGPTDVEDLMGGAVIYCDGIEVGRAGPCLPGHALAREIHKKVVEPGMGVALSEDQGEAAPARSHQGGLGHKAGKTRGHRGIDRVATGPQHLRARFRGMHTACCNNALGHEWFTDC